MWHFRTPKKPRSLNHAAGLRCMRRFAAKSSRGLYRQMPNTLEVVGTSSGPRTSPGLGVHLVFRLQADTKPQPVLSRGTPCCDFMTCCECMRWADFCVACQENTVSVAIQCAGVAQSSQSIFDDGRGSLQSLQCRETQVAICAQCT